MGGESTLVTDLKDLILSINNAADTYTKEMVINSLKLILKDRKDILDVILQGLTVEMSVAGAKRSIVALRKYLNNYYRGEMISNTVMDAAYKLRSGAVEDKDVLDILKPVISEIMGDAEPICRYDLSTTFISNKKLDDESNNKSWMDEKFKKETIECMCPTIEWNIIEPESRIRSLISKCGTEIENLQLLNGKNISDYVEKGQAYTLTRKPEKK